MIATLERALPASLPVGTGTSVLCQGAHEPGRLMLRAGQAGGWSRAISGARREDGRQSFWGLVAIEPQSTAGKLAIEASLDTQTEVLAELEITAKPQAPAISAVPQSAALPLIAVCMATFDPDPALLVVQLESLRAQHDTSWVCLISDDCSDPARFAELERLVGKDARFVLSRSTERLGFFRNFERALSMVPAEAALVALSDQDDRWHPDKLGTLRAALGSAQLVYSDQRLTDARGRVLRETMWRGRSNNHTSLTSMVVANTITGAAILMRRELAQLALPFPDPPGFQFHDHWLAVLALAAGEIAYVPRPLYDYVQHPGAVFGDVSSGSRAKRLRRPAPRRWLERMRASYVYGYLSRALMAEAALMRCGDRLSASKRAELERFLAAQDSPLALARLALRPARELRGHSETLGSEAALAAGILWSRLAAARGNPAPPPLDAFSQKRLRRWRARI